MDRGAWWAMYSPWGLKELDTTEQLTHTSFIPISSPSPNQLPQSSSLPCLCPILLQAITACNLELLGKKSGWAHVQLGTCTREGGDNGAAPQLSC